MPDQNDQAASLRSANKSLAPEPAFGIKGRKSVCAVSIASGKGGVGKTFVSVNLAVTMAQTERKVLLVDADLGLANADIVLGVKTEFTMQDAIFKGKPIRDIILKPKYGVDIISASSGSKEMVSLGAARMQMFIQELLELAAEYDVILFDCAAGIDSNVTSFLAAAPHSLIVTTPQPTSLMDVYALTKIIYQNGLSNSLGLVVNMADNDGQGEAVAATLNSVMSKFLSGKIDLMGVLPSSDRVNAALKRRTPFVAEWSKDPVSIRFKQLANKLLRRAGASEDSGLDGESLLKGFISNS